MHKSVLFLPLILIQLLAFSFLPQRVLAGDLGALVKLDRQAVSKSTGGTICVIPETNGTEGSVQVIFPTGMTVNPNSSNWTVTTTNLPTGAIALPGAGTATAVSGQMVTFPSNDLTTGTQYCFNFSSSSTLTTPSTTGTFVGTLRTRNTSNTVIDTHAYGISITTNDQISVTATVPANPTDFNVNLDLTSPGNGTFSPDTVLTYTITYGSILTYPSDITVEAEWNLGTVQGDVAPTENVVDYVVSSASNILNSAAPVVDTLNHKIDWTIHSFQANTPDQTVTFQLRTNNSYTGTLPVSFAVNGRVLGPGTVTPDSTVTSTYKYAPPLTPAPTSTPTPGSTTTSTPTPTLQPSPRQMPGFKINDIQVRTVTSTEAAVFVSSNKKASITVKYGTNENTLNKIQTSSTFANDHLIRLTGLEPNTRYYFRVIVKDTSSNSITSGLYLLDTALPSSLPKLKIGSLILTSGYVALNDPFQKESTLSNIVLPFNTPYSFQFEVLPFANIKSVSVLLRNSNVLGATSDDAPNLEEIAVSEAAPGRYIGQLKAGTTPGTYRLIAQLRDFNGNVTEEPLSIFHIVQPLSIIDATTSQGIEKANVVFYLYNSRFKVYELIPSSLTPIQNPSFSDANGVVDVVLPDGTYRAQITALGFALKTVDFSIGSTSPNYPIVKLSPLPFSLGTFAKYTATAAMDIVMQIKSSLDAIRTSFRFFDLAAFLIITLLVLLLTITTSKRFAVPITQLPYFAFYHLVSVIKKPKHAFLVHGRVLVAGSEEPLSGALLYLYSSGRKIIAHTHTNLYGEFLAKVHEDMDIQVSAHHSGYKNSSVVVKKDELNNKISIEISKSDKPSGLTFASVKWYIEYILSTLVEALLLLSLGMEVLFSIEFGIIKTLPFIIVSLINIILWAINARASRTG
jgi:hypothetical protein